MLKLQLKVNIFKSHSHHLLIDFQSLLRESVSYNHVIF